MALRKTLHVFTWSTSEKPASDQPSLAPLSPPETSAEGTPEAPGEDRGEAEGAAGDGAQVQHGEGEGGAGHCQVAMTHPLPRATSARWVMQSPLGMNNLGVSVTGEMSTGMQCCAAQQSCCRVLNGCKMVSALQNHGNNTNTPNGPPDFCKYIIGKHCYRAWCPQEKRSL